MKTLIELYDERPLENVLGAEVFRPERVVYICPKPVAEDESICRRLKTYFRHRKLECSVIFKGVNIFSADDILRVLRSVISHYPGCCIDVSGGTDDLLFSAGVLAAEHPDLPVVTYSRRKNAFFNIRGAEFADGMACNVQYQVEDCFLMAGGSMRKGRVDNAVLDNYLPYFDAFFQVFLKRRRTWPEFVTYMQRVSAPDRDGNFKLTVKGDYTVKGEHGSRVSADEAALHELQDMGFLYDLQIERGSKVSFRFRDAQVRTWLRDVGSVLELYTYKACLDTGLFQNVITSAVVDWEGTRVQNGVTNELDVMATRGVTPVFISCKTCDIKTEALNELAILKDRFGGQIARAAIVSAERAGSSARNRAAKLGITVIDIDDLQNGDIHALLAALMD